MGRQGYSLRCGQGCMMKRYCRGWGVEATFDIRFWLGFAGFGVRAGPRTPIEALILRIFWVQGLS